jgi:hypothetical protein
LAGPRRRSPHHASACHPSLTFSARSVTVRNGAPPSLERTCLRLKFPVLRELTGESSIFGAPLRHFFAQKPTQNRDIQFVGDENSLKNNREFFSR